MKNNKVFYGLIPAKNKSARLKNKNLLKISNKTLLEIAVDCSKKCSFIKETYVSTNSNKIHEICKKIDVRVVKRLKKYTSNEAPVSFVIIDFIKQLKLKNTKNTYIVLLQTTSPTRNLQHLKQAFKKLKSSKKNFLVSVKKNDNNILKSYYLKNSKYLPVYNSNASTTNQQDLPKVISPNGAIYIFSVKDFLKKNRIPTKEFIPFMMKEEESIDIDLREDYLKAKKILEKSNLR
jgi:N-acylneuraminate cytidylyltransferase/CMP-N,N'-diacetyllegionaminic acid synthase